MLFCQESQAREQWQIPRPDAPPTSPVESTRGYGVQYSPPGQVPGAPLQQSQGMPGQVPGLTGYGAGAGSGQVPGLTGYGNGQLPGTPGFGQIPGLTGGQMPPGVVPGLVQPGSPVPSGMPPLSIPPGKGVTPELIKSIIGKRINPGTVLTGVMESEISSGKSKRGDVFSILLPYGYNNDGEEIVPLNSRILGVVVESIPSKTLKAGHPGRLNISVKTLVFPDGRTCNINGYIDHNPAHDQESEPKTRFAGMNGGDYGKAFKGMLYSSVAGISWVHNSQMRGKEFKLKPGTPVAIKLNTSVDVAKMTNPTSPLSVPGLVGGPGVNAGYPPPVPGLVGDQSQNPYPTQGHFQGQKGQSPAFPPATGFVPPQGYVPPAGGAPAVGLTPYPPQAPQAVPPQGQPNTFFPANMTSPDQFAGSPAAVPVQEDPNSIFKTPIASPNISTPEPF